jgi:hypothetical protein
VVRLVALQHDGGSEERSLRYGGKVGIGTWFWHTVSTADCYGAQWRPSCGVVSERQRGGETRWSCRVAAQRCWRAGQMGHVENERVWTKGIHLEFAAVVEPVPSRVVSV